MNAAESHHSLTVMKKINKHNTKYKIQNTSYRKNTTHDEKSSVFPGADLGYLVTGYLSVLEVWARRAKPSEARSERAQLASKTAGGSGGRCKPPQRGPGAEPRKIFVFGLSRSRGAIFL